ncbi:MAG: HEPN domain-containing protein [Candidatus Thorarchaeota archaeon]
MHKEEVQLLLKRSANFLEAAEERYEKEDWDLTCFFAEQAIQLYLKANILKETGQTPRTHSIRQLVALLREILKKDMDFDRKSLFLLESAYYNARYIAITYDKEQATEIIEITKEIINYVKNI